MSDLRPWCCKHRWTLYYVAAVVTIELPLLLQETTGVLW